MYAFFIYPLSSSIFFFYARQTIDRHSEVCDLNLAALDFMIILVFDEDHLLWKTPFFCVELFNISKCWQTLHCKYL